MERETKLQDLMDGIMAEMKRLRYCRASVDDFRLNCRRYADFAASEGKEGVFSEELGIKFLAPLYDKPDNVKLRQRDQSTVRTIRRLGEYRLYGAYNGKFEVIKADYGWAGKDTSLIEAYWNSRQRIDDSKATRKNHLYRLRYFYDFLGFRKIESAVGVDAQLISDYALSLQGKSSGSVYNQLSVLKLFLRFLFANGYCNEDLAMKVPKVTVRRNLNIPALWKPEEISELLDSIDRGNPAGKRDYAMLLMVSQLGIRISDIATLRLNNLKWERRTIEFTQHKTGKPVVFPMLDDVGWALIDYIRYGRADVDNPYIFLTARVPYKEFQSADMVGQAMSSHMKRCGIRKDAPRTTSGAHSLRHALARRLAEENTPLPTIISIMGHTSHEGTSKYLKVDIEGLRECALSLEGVTGYEQAL